MQSGSEQGLLYGNDKAVDLEECDEWDNQDGNDKEVGRESLAEPGRGGQGYLDAKVTRGKWDI